MEDWLTLGEASEITGKSIPALRQNIKRGKLSAKKVPSPRGQQWVIDPESLSAMQKSDDYENEEDCDETDQEDPLQAGQIGLNMRGQSANLYERLIREKDERAGEQARYLAVMEKLITDFQSRTQNLELDRMQLQSQLKLLPASPQEMIGKMDEKERTISDLSYRLEDSERRIQAEKGEVERLRKEKEELESRLRAEQETPWWKKIFE